MPKEQKRIQNTNSFVFLLIAIAVLSGNLVKAQTYVFAQLQGAPVNTSGWNLQGYAKVANVKNNDLSEILLCPSNLTFQSGAIFYNRPLNLSICNKWTAEFDFRIFDGSMADGIAFCFLDVPPMGFVAGGGMGIPATANGLKVCFDPNPNCAPYATNVLPKIEIRYGAGYDECWNQPTVQNDAAGKLNFVRSDTYNHAKITYDSGNISVYVNNILYLTGFQQFNFSGYMGFTASTGARTDNHSIKNAIIYTDMPTSDAGTDQQICSGGSAQLGTTPVNTNVYTWSPSAGLSATNIANPVITLTNTTTIPIIKKYYVATGFSNNSGCTSVDSVLVTVNPAPAAAITVSANNTCSGAAITFTASPTINATYLWYKNGVSTGITTPTYSSNSFQNNDQVSCTIINASQCSATSNIITLNINTTQLPPAISITTPLTTVCAGTAATFTAVAVNGGTAPVYQWKVNGTVAGTNSNTYTANNFSNNDVVTCQLISNAPCVAPAPVLSNTITMNVNTITQPTATIIASSNNICAGLPVTFSMNVTDGTPLSYQWKVNGVNVSSNSTFISSSLVNQDKVSCDIVVNTLCATGIALSGNLTMEVNPVANATVSISASASSICQGAPVTFTAAANNGNSNIIYQWQVNNVNVGTDGMAFTTNTLQNNDMITCRITPQNIPCLVQGTVVSNSITMEVNALPTVSLQPAQSIVLGNSITLNPDITGNIAQYVWSPAIGLNSTSIRNPVATPANNIVYSLKVISTGGCMATATTSIQVFGKKITVSNAFTPNADGINDTWLITDLVNYPKCTVDVFNRYGTKLFHSLGYAQAWDGSYNKKPVPAGVYYYIIDLNNGSKPETGVITVIR